MYKSNNEYSESLLCSSVVSIPAPQPTPSIVTPAPVVVSVISSAPATHTTGVASTVSTAMPTIPTPVAVVSQQSAAATVPATPQPQKVPRLVAVLS